MIISVHTPKTGGSSFKQALSEEFGDRLRLDYEDFPLNKSLSTRIRELDTKKKDFDRTAHEFLAKFDCVHGHFMPYKYSSLVGRGDAAFVTWLRDPIERLGSHYHFWKRAYDPSRSRALHRRVVEENWSIERFVFSSEMQNVYAQFFLHFPIEDFNFIGITEFYETEFHDFCRIFLHLNSWGDERINQNPDKPSVYFSDPVLLKELREFHSDDFEIYEFALAQRLIRLGKS